MKTNKYACVATVHRDTGYVTYGEPMSLDMVKQAISFGAPNGYYYFIASCDETGKIDDED